MPFDQPPFSPPAPKRARPGLIFLLTLVAVWLIPVPILALASPRLPEWVTTSAQAALEHVLVLPLYVFPYWGLARVYNGPPILGPGLATLLTVLQWGTVAWAFLRFTKPLSRWWELVGAAIMTVALVTLLVHLAFRTSGLVQMQIVI